MAPRKATDGKRESDCAWRRMWIRSTCGLVAMTSASHAEGRQLDPGQGYFVAAVSMAMEGYVCKERLGDD